MTATSGPSYRQVAAEAKQCIKRLQPSIPKRWWCLAVLSDAIQAAHRAAPSRWGVTLHPDAIRLNVGMIEVFLVSESSQVYLVFDAPTLSKLPATHTKPYLNADALRDLAAGQPGAWLSHYRSVEGSLGSYLELDHLPTSYPLLRPAHQTLIRNAGTTRRHPMTRDAHSPGVIDYLCAETGWALPQPVYS